MRGERCTSPRFSNGRTPTTSARAPGPTSIPDESGGKRRIPGAEWTVRCGWASAACRAARPWPGCWPSSAGSATAPACPRLTLKQILAWADDHFATNRLLAQGSLRRDPRGPAARPGSPWTGPCGPACAALRAARRCPRSWPGTARVRNIQQLPPLTIKIVLKWADAHRRRTGPGR